MGEVVLSLVFLAVPKDREKKGSGVNRVTLGSMCES